MSAHLDEIKDTLAELTTGVKEVNERSIRLATDTRTLKEEVGKLRRLLIEGNGQPPLTHRVALNEQEVRSLRESLRAAQAGRVQIKAALIGSVFAVLGTILTAILGYLR